MQRMKNLIWASCHFYLVQRSLPEQTFYLQRCAFLFIRETPIFVGNIGRHKSFKMSVPDKTRQALQEAFYLFDYDNDGRIAASELGVIIRSVGLNPTERLLKEMSNDVNSKGGSVDLNGLLQLISGRYQEMTTTAAELADSFQVFDKQGNNTVSVADIKHGLSSLGERLTEEEIDGLFREADPNAEGTCNINDLVDLLIK